ncbi:MAG: DUF4351 domain-containing protein [Thiocapsa sp.]|uniref:DUF4351 domain-containing protein n=1 Tax=Thiocapsa sp. TaxID=2024551 RepID=UPI001BCCACB5|nr:DUF4351 domain-containing protein [Thiocapsa sp.]QVL49328.1 MAG: DUF4351 domain-containing protein [Thiocapsa sp.]
MLSGTDARALAAERDSTADPRETLDLIDLVLRLLTRRCGALTQPRLEKIQVLDSTQLGTLGEALLDFGSVADLDACLREH